MARRGVLVSRRWKVRRAIRAIDRLGADAELIEKTAESLIYSNFRDLNDMERRYVRRYADRAILRSKVFLSHEADAKRLDNGESQSAKIRAFMRIPVDELMGIRKLDKADRLVRLAELMTEYDKQGNRCGHNPLHFAEDGRVSPYDSGSSFDEDIGGKRLPQVIYETIDRLIEAVLNPADYKLLFFKATNKVVARWNEAMRQHRSDGREGMIKVLITLLKSWHPRSMRSGLFDKATGKMSGISIATLARWSGLTESRVTTALRLLEDHNILFRGKQRRDKKDDGSMLGLPVVRVFQPFLWSQLKLNRRLTNERVDRAEKAADVPASELERYVERKANEDFSNVRSVSDIFASEGVAANFAA